MGAEPQPPRPELSLETLEVGGVERTFFVHTPPAWSAEASQTWPAVLVFHGGGRGGDTKGGDMARTTRMNPAADANGFIAVYPNGWTGTWFPPDRTPPDAVDDVVFLRALVGELSTRWHADGDRVSVAGFSAGGHLAQRLACGESDWVTAAVSVTALLAEDADARCEPTHKRPILYVFATEDETHPYEGGTIDVQLKWRDHEPTTILSAAATLERWAVRSGCSGPPQRTDHPDRRGNAYRVFEDRWSCPEGLAVRGITVEGARHGWPMPPKVVDLHTTNQVVAFLHEFGAI
jgi:polyhydroxybutyrate depolymerase